MNLSQYRSKLESYFNWNTQDGRQRCAIAAAATTVTIATASYLLATRNNKKSNKQHSNLKEIPYEGGNFLIGHATTHWSKWMDLVEKYQTKHPDIVTIRMAPGFDWTLIGNPDMIAEFGAQQEHLTVQGADVFETMIPDSIFTADEIAWRRRRKAMVHCLKMVKLNTLVPCFIRMFEESLSQKDDTVFPNEMPRDYQRVLSDWIFESFGELAFGKGTTLGDLPQSFASVNEELFFRFTVGISWFGKLLSSIPCPRKWRYNAAMADVDERIRQVINRLESPEARGSVVAKIVEYSQNAELESDRLTEGEIRDLIWILFLAGYDTTSNQIGFNLYCLAKNKEVQNELYRRLIENGLPRPNEPLDASRVEEAVRTTKYLDWCMEEGTRHFPVGIGTHREVKNDMVVGDYLLKKGAYVSGSMWGSRFDSDAWKSEYDVKAFEPLRWENLDVRDVSKTIFIPFGVGKRDCAGQRFARLEMRIMTALLLSRFEIDAVEGKDVEISIGTVVTSRNGYWFNMKARE